MAGSGSRSAPGKGYREVIRPEATSSRRLPLSTYCQLGFQSVGQDTTTPLPKRSRGLVVPAQVEGLPRSADKWQMSHEEKFKMASEHFVTAATQIAGEFKSNMKDIVDEVEHSQSSIFENENLKKVGMQEKIKYLTKRNFDLQELLVDNHKKLKMETGRRVEAERLYASVVCGGGKGHVPNSIDLNVNAVINVDATEENVVPTECGHPYWWKGSNSGH